MVSVRLMLMWLVGMAMTVAVMLMVLMVTC